ncbi:MAG: type III secretion T3S chaperone [Waddliaceae bacterium]|nr:type III secretion T3S chaperone [Waddliaceae bacterium]
MDKAAYPLAQVLEVKKKRVEDAEKLVEQRIKELDREKEKLKEVEAARDKVLQHFTDKIDQLRQKFDEGITSPEIIDSKRYIKIVHEKLQVEEEKVNKQKEQVEVAEKSLELARKELAQKRKEVDKLRMHREEWWKEERNDRERKEAIEQDEIGNVIHLKKMREKLN